MLVNLKPQKRANKGSIRILIGFNHSSDVRLALVCAKLTEFEIPYQVIDEGIGTLEPFMSAFGGPKIMVHQRHYDTALRVVQSLDITQAETKPPLSIDYLWLIPAILMAVTLVYWWYSKNS